MVSGQLPPLSDEGLLAVQPLVILDRKLAKKGNVGVVYVLVQWMDDSPENATWELASDMMARFPQFNLYP